MSNLSPFWLNVGIFTGSAVALVAIGWFIIRNIPAKRVLSSLPFVMAVIGMMLWAGSKPRVTWPTYIVDAGSCFDTNGWQWVELRWKIWRDFPRDIPLTIDAKHATGDWFNLDACLSGLLTNRIDLTGLPDHPTNYIFRVTSEYNPGTVEIKDFSATASTTSMAVVCRWTSPTNLVGLVGSIQYRLHEPPGSPWTHAFNVVVERTNEVYVAGNFVNRRIDRDFRLVVIGFNPFRLLNRTDAQLKDRFIQQRLNLQWFILPRIKHDMKLLGPTSIKGARL